MKWSLNPFLFRAGVLLARCRPARFPPVSIPFCSGLVCFFADTERSDAAIRLNPFLFRAGVLRHDEGCGNARYCLNPFLFRAGVLLYICWSSGSCVCLNPFLFRAGVLLASEHIYIVREMSQSLFVQGWCASLLREKATGISKVSIPFCSGLVCFKADAHQA